MNLKLTVFLLLIFAALYYGYPKYQDKKVIEQIRTELKKPISQSEFMGAAPPEIANQLNASLVNNYPTLNFTIRLKQINKSDLNKTIINDMKDGGFIGACGGFYKNAGKQPNAYAREMLAKVVKEDNVTMSYLVKDKIGKEILTFSRPISDCPNFSTLEAGGIPYIPAPIQ